MDRLLKSARPFSNGVRKEYDNIATFHRCFISKMIHMATVTMEDSYAIYRMVSVSVTLNDP